MFSPPVEADSPAVWQPPLPFRQRRGWGLPLKPTRRRSGSRPLPFRRGWGLPLKPTRRRPAYLCAPGALIVSLARTSTGVLPLSQVRSSGILAPFPGAEHRDPCPFQRCGAPGSLPVSTMPKTRAPFPSAQKHQDPWRIPQCGSPKVRQIGLPPAELPKENGFFMSWSNWRRRAGRLYRGPGRRRCHRTRPSGAGLAT